MNAYSFVRKKNLLIANETDHSTNAIIRMQSIIHSRYFHWYNSLPAVHKKDL